MILLSLIAYYNFFLGIRNGCDDEKRRRLLKKKSCQTPSTSDWLLVSLTSFGVASARCVVMVTSEGFSRGTSAAGEFVEGSGLPSDTPKPTTVQTEKLLLCTRNIKTSIKN